MKFVCLFLFLVFAGRMVVYIHFSLAVWNKHQTNDCKEVDSFKNIYLQFMVLDKQRLRDSGTSPTTYAFAYLFIFVYEFMFWNKARSHIMNRILSNKKCSNKTNRTFFWMLYDKRKFIVPRYSNPFSLAVAKESYNYWQGRKRTIK